jgi:hypothetical protein
MGQLGKETLKRFGYFQLGGIAFVVFTITFFYFTFEGLDITLDNIGRVAFNWFVELWWLHLIFLAFSSLGALDKVTDKPTPKPVKLKKERIGRLKEPIKIFLNSEDVTAKYDLIVHSRINNCGTKFVEADNSHLDLDDSIRCHCLSISNKRWIGTTGMSSYIVELVEKPKPLPQCPECGGVRFRVLPEPHQHIQVCDDCGHPTLV